MSSFDGSHLDIEKIVDVDLERELKKYYIAYSMSVIVGRALPDVRDGLKPVHRRILYTMYEDGLSPDKAHRKAATTIGDVLGRYHPHGDVAVYDALVRLAQDFSLRYPLVDGHGNFGSVDGDPPAAYRYTEARMSRLATEMITDIEKETVDFLPNFDGRLQEPQTLPSRFPNLLVNGSTGIAVGMATNIPAHNLSEVIDATIEVIDNPMCELDDLMEHIKGPDFPTAGIIFGKSGIRSAYSTGRGKIRVRARAEIEEFSNGRYRIAVTELPYAVNKARLVENIADLVKDKQIEGISDLRDESDRDGMRMVVELKRDANAQVVLNQLYSRTQMQTTFAVNMLALVKGEPKTLSLREILDNYIEYQQTIIRRRTQFDLKKAEARAHILEGLRIALDHIDEVIAIIRSSYNNARGRLCERFGFTEIQAQAILDMRLLRLQGLEREKIDAEFDELMKKIAYYKEILGSGELVLKILKEELLDIKRRFGDARRTEITVNDDEIDIEDLIEVEDCVFTRTHLGYIKRLPTATYRSQRRGGRGISGMSTREEDFVETLFIASTHDHILFFTNRGRMYRKKGYNIPETGRTAKGMNIVNLLPLEAGEFVTAMIPVASFDEGSFLVMVTKRGIIKRISLARLDTARKAGVRALTIGDDDELICVRLTDGTQQVIIATRLGMAIRFKETDVRAMGRDAAGVYGMDLREDDRVVGAACAREGAALLTVTERGYGKRTDLAEYRLQSRYGKGLKNYNLTEKTGDVAGVLVVDDNDDVMLIADDGVIIRMAASDISIYGRSTQGVILMRVGENFRVISIARTEKEESSEGDAEEEAETEQE